MKTVYPWKLEWAARTDRGRQRQKNEDYVAYHIPRELEKLEGLGALGIVADGMGGGGAGEVASQMATQLVRKAYYEGIPSNPEQSLLQVVERANAALLEESRLQGYGDNFGTTLVAVVIHTKNIYGINVGDTRAYLIGQGITQLTQDQSWVAEQVRAGVLTEAQARSHPWRHMVTQAVGAQPRLEPDTFTSPIHGGESLVLCSDGLWQQVDGVEIGNIVRSHEPGVAAKVLVELANQRGGSDNITVLIAKIEVACNGGVPL